MRQGLKISQMSKRTQKMWIPRKPRLKCTYSQLKNICILLPGRSQTYLLSMYTCVYRCSSHRAHKTMSRYTFWEKFCGIDNNSILRKQSINTVLTPPCLDQQALTGTGNSNLLPEGITETFMGHKVFKNRVQFSKSVLSGQET